MSFTCKRHVSLLTRISHLSSPSDGLSSFPQDQTRKWCQGRDKNSVPEIFIPKRESNTANITWICWHNINLETERFFLGMKCMTMRISLNFTLIFQRPLLTCLRSQMKQLILLLDAESANGFTIRGCMSHFSINLLIKRWWIAFVTNSLRLIADRFF